MTNSTQRPVQPPVLQRRTPGAAPAARRPAAARRAPAAGGPAAQPMATPRARKGAVSSTELLVWIGVGGAALAVLAVIGFFSFFVLFTLSDRILPGVAVGTTDIGGMKVEQASQVLWTEWNENRRLTVTDGVNYWQDTPAQFGLYLDSAATAAKAYEIGRGTEGLSQFFGMLAPGREHVLPEVVIDMETARRKLTLYAAMVDVPAADATVVYEDGTWAARPGKAGIALDIPHSLAALVEQRTLVMSSGIVTLALQPVPPQFEDVSAALSQLEPLLNRPMRFEAYDPILDEAIEWSVEPQTFAPWVRIENLAGSPELAMDPEPLKSYLVEWQAQLGGNRVLQDSYDVANVVAAWKSGDRYSFIVWHLPTTYQVQSGDMLTEIAYQARMPYWKLIEANPGIDPDRLQAGDSLVIPSLNEMLPEPVVRSKRIVISISSQRMWTYENGTLLQEYIISTGVDESPTLPGVYQVQTHELMAYASVWDLYMPHFIGIYQGWPGFWNGIHGLPTLSSGVRLWESVLGRKASFGCIIMDLASAETVYNWAETGVVVEIQP